MLRINNITLSNFKAYKEQKFDFSYLTVFCGSNSVGKSTAIQAVGIFLQSIKSEKMKINGELVHIGNIDDIHNFNNLEDDKLLVGISTNQYYGLWGYRNSEDRDLLASGDELPLVEREMLSFSNENNTKGLDDFNYQYLHAERLGPRDNLPLGQHNYKKMWLGTKGEHTIEVLEILVNERRGELTSSVEGEDPRKHDSVMNLNIINNIEAWMGEITPGYTINPKKIREANVTFNTILANGRNKLKPINIGFGYSYALSVVTSLLVSTPGDIVIIENPEAHLHPKGQSFIGRLIALTAQANIQVIIETHSDHVMNGIRLMVRANKVSNDKVSFYQVYQENESTNVIKINLNNQGQFSEWPKDFFDQQVIDMNMLISGEI